MLAMSQELGVKLIGCQMTMDVMGLQQEAFVDGVEVGGAVTFLTICSKMQMSLLTF